MENRPLSLKEYNQLQIVEMEKHKWIESEKAGRDLGPAAYRDWVSKWAAKFREEHEVVEEHVESNSIQQLEP